MTTVSPVTKLQKEIYNCWLATSRSKSGQPFKLRRRWKGFEEKPEWVYLKKIENILNKHKINAQDWIEAPYVAYHNEPGKPFELKFYTLPKAFVCYKVAKTKKQRLEKDKQNS